MILSNKQTPLVEIPMAFIGCLHNSFVCFVLFSNSLRPWLLALHLSWSYLGQINFFLQPQTTLMGFNIFFHIMLQMVTSSSLLDNRCCRRTLWMTSPFPSLSHKWVRRLITCLPISGLPTLSIYQFADDRLNYNPDVFLMLCAGSSKIVWWIEFLYLMLFGLVLHASGGCC